MMTEGPPTTNVSERSICGSSKAPAEARWLVSFMNYDLGYFDLETGVLEPLENPFDPKVLPIS